MSTAGLIAGPTTGEATGHARLGRPALGVGAALVASAAAIAISAATAARGAELRYALVNGLIVLVPITVGAYATRRESSRAFGRRLIAAGLIWSMAALAASDVSLPYSLGRIGGWFVTAFVVLLVLSYPSGRLATRLDRALFAAAVALVGGLFLPTALLVERFPAPSPWAMCTRDCPPNAFMLLDHTPAFVGAWVVPARELLMVALLFGVFGSIAARVRRASALQRRTLMPVLVASAALVASLAACVIVRRASPGAAALGPLFRIYALSIPGLAIGFLVGMVRWQAYTARALERLAVGVQGDVEPARLRRVLARALQDPRLEIVEVPDHPPEAGPGRAATALGDPRRPAALLLHDAALRDDPGFLEAVRVCALAAIERRELLAAVAEEQHELAQSRAQLMADADRERRRIERDLHDGAQQHLIALRIKLALASERLRTQERRDPTLLNDLGAEVEEIIDEIRALASGVYPSLLTDHGLEAALLAVARRAPLPVQIDVRDVGRHPEEVEVAVYFACVEALQNAAKHAPEATVRITVRAGAGRLRFEVRDDGPGFVVEQVPHRRGLTHMHDRVAAVDGTLVVRSAPGRGTRVTGEVPTGAVRPSGGSPQPEYAGLRM
jgi:signal transduction histidine kinase